MVTTALSRKKARRNRALSELSRQVSTLNINCLKELWDNGNKEVRNWVKDHLTLMPRIISSRVLVYRADDPLRVYLRETSSKRLGIIGGSIEVERDGTLEDALVCAIREAGEEGEFQDLRKKHTEVLTLVGKNSMRVSRKKAILRGLINRRIAKGRRVRVQDPMVVMYATPTEEDFKCRRVHETKVGMRRVVCVNLRKFFGKSATKDPRNYFRPTHIRVLESWYWYHQRNEVVPAAMILKKGLPASS
ncbi:MAG: hypothetical protein KDD62_00050 [Bdellovibrionales bacterium]|nr:hypothetical protein [Bdellovibrionales bacterium]